MATHLYIPTSAHPGSGWAAQITCSSQEPLVRHPTFSSLSSSSPRVHPGALKGRCDLTALAKIHSLAHMQCRESNHVASSVRNSTSAHFRDGESKVQSTDTIFSARDERVRTHTHIRPHMDTWTHPVMIMNCCECEYMLYTVRTYEYMHTLYDEYSMHVWCHGLLYYVHEYMNIEICQHTSLYIVINTYLYTTHTYTKSYRKIIEE